MWYVVRFLFHTLKYLFYGAVAFGLYLLFGNPNGTF